MVKRLETEVWELDNCSGCGMCVAACSKQVLAWQDDGHPVLQTRTKNLGLSKTTLDSCSFCQKFCEEVCPRLDHWMPIEAQTIQAVHARGPIFSGAPNDVIRAVISAGRSAGLLDGMIMLDLDRWNLKPVARIGTTVEQIVDTVGPQYLWAPIFDMLNEAIFEQKMENIAVIGTPCTAQAIRKLRSSTNPLLKPYQDAIRLSVAVFCTGVYKPEMIEEVLVNRMNVPRDQVRRLEISPDRQWLRATLWAGSVRTIQRQQAESYSRPGCGKCDDFLGESADLAVGSLGAPADASTMIVRSQTGDIFVRNAIQMGLLEATPDAVDLQALEAAASEKDRRERAQAFKDLEILMLDGLVDPKKRSEAIQQFIRLYRTPARPGVVENVPRGCTGC